MCISHIHKLYVFRCALYYASNDIRVTCRGAIHCARIPGRCIGDGRNELRPYTISSCFTRKDAEPVNSYLMTCPHILSV